MRKLIIIICAALLLLHPCNAWAEPAVYRTVAFAGRNTEVSLWYGSGRMPTHATTVVANTRRGKSYIVRLTYWTGIRWAKVQTMTARAEKDGETLFFTAALYGIRSRKGADIKLKINGRLLKLDCRQVRKEK